jgi:HSP20 family protein
MLRHAPEWHRSAATTAWQPRVDICENADEVCLQVELAGVAEDAVQLRFEPGQLIIEGDRPRPELASPRRCLQVEIEYGRFRRALPLPADIDGTNIEAQLDKGILYITARRRPKSTSENIRISVG